VTFRWTSMAIVAVVSAVWVAPAESQLVSVRCCTEENHLALIGDCVSGEGALMQPDTCPPSATCILGFGENTQLMAALCDPETNEIPPIPTRAYCSSWLHAATPVVHECVAKPEVMATLFTVYDDDGDGDLDESDVAVFEKVRETVPKLVQSEAVLTYVECCVAEEVIRNIGVCLSGPGVTTTPLPCDGAAPCVAGFSAPVETGDYLHELCGEPAVLPKPGESYCLAWQADDVPTAFLCLASNYPGNNYFIVSDTDGDADVDLSDFAVFQQEWGVPE